MTSGRFHRMWMHSDGHRANDLWGAYSRIGVGVHRAPDGRVFAVERFVVDNWSGAPPYTVPPLYPVVHDDEGGVVIG